MRELLYAMRFSGQATPVGTAGSVLKAATTAPSSVLTSIIGPDGLTSSLKPIDGESATFESEVTFTSESSFQEVGTISFGNGNVVRFGTVNSGYLGASPDSALKHGTVMWRVEGGGGQFTGATGLITSNFFVGADLTVTDHHFGVIFLA
jgi:hypothetical protein